MEMKGVGIVKQNRFYLIGALLMSITLLTGCINSSVGTSPSLAPSAPVPAVQPSVTPPPSTPEQTPPASPTPAIPTKLLNLTQEAECERYHFSVKYPEEWSAVIQGEVVDAPDQGIIIYVDDTKDLMSSIHVFGDVRGQIHPGDASKDGNTIIDFSTASGITGKRYNRLDANGIRWDVFIFGEYDDYAIWIRLEDSFYLEYKPTIDAIIDSFTFLGDTV